MKLKSITSTLSKVKNKRVFLELLENVETGELLVYLMTKRLIDFKTRDIVKYEGLYSLETFMIIRGAIQTMFGSEMFFDIIKEQTDAGKFSKPHVDILVTGKLTKEICDDEN